MIANIFKNSRSRKFALEGRINFRPLFFLMCFNLLLGFLSYAVFNVLEGHSFAQLVISLGSHISPSVERVSALSVEPVRCAFVVAGQWLLGFLYIPLLLSIYWPFSKTIRVAVMEWRKRQPPESISGGNFKFVIFYAFLIVWALGDLGVVGFPTLYNGLLLSGGAQFHGFGALINSPVFLPVSAWFSAFAAVLVYWCGIYLFANWRALA